MEVYSSDNELDIVMDGRMADGVRNLDLGIQNLNQIQPAPVGGVGVTRGLSDDDFFHLICHVDQGLKERKNRKGRLC